MTHLFLYSSVALH